MGVYGVANLEPSTDGMTVQTVGEIRSEQVSAQLTEIRDATNAVFIDEEPQAGRIGLQSIVIDLTVGAEGKVLFVAKGSVEASIQLTFSRPAAQT